MTPGLVLTMGGVFAAALLRGFTGFGFGLVAVPLLSVALPPAQVVPLVVTLQVVVGLIGLWDAGKACDWRSVALLAPGLVLGVPVGLLMLTELPPNPVRLLIAVIIGFSVVLLYRGGHLPARPPRLLTGFVGLMSGVINGLASMGGPPVIVYLMALGLTAARVRATSIVYFMLAGCVSLAPMAARGLLSRDTLALAAASLPALFGGSWLGTRAFHRAKPRHHRMTALVSLSALAAILVGRALWR